jgi:hypothetical protein
MVVVRVMMVTGGSEGGDGDNSDGGSNDDGGDGSGGGEDVKYACCPQ